MSSSFQRVSTFKWGQVPFKRRRWAYLLIEIVSDHRVSTGKDLMGLCEEPFLEAYVTGAVLAGVLRNMELVWKLIGLQLSI